MTLPHKTKSSSLTKKVCRNTVDGMDLAVRITEWQKVLTLGVTLILVLSLYSFVQFFYTHSGKAVRRQDTRDSHQASRTHEYEVLDILWMP